MVVVLSFRSQESISNGEVLRVKHWTLLNDLKVLKIVSYAVGKLIRLILIWQKVFNAWDVCVCVFI